MFRCIVARLSATARTLCETLAKVDVLHVTYKGGNLALNDQVGGRVDVIFSTL
jgi:tripartite-type tricarboxylate transporter receptor subunit TctC